MFLENADLNALFVYLTIIENYKDKIEQHWNIWVFANHLNDFVLDICISQ